MKPAWRGVVIDGVVWAWPTVLLTHDEAFAVLPWLGKCSCRFRQWDADERVDFDTGTSTEDEKLVEKWVKEH